MQAVKALILMLAACLGAADCAVAAEDMPRPRLRPAEATAPAAPAVAALVALVSYLTNCHKNALRGERTLRTSSPPHQQLPHNRRTVLYHTRHIRCCASRQYSTAAPAAACPPSQIVRDVVRDLGLKDARKAILPATRRHRRLRWRG